jgi:hypothetical protein
VHEIPGRALGIWAFVLSFFVQPLALVFGIIALRQSRRAGVPNGLAVSGVVISAVVLVAVGITAIALVAVVG